MKGPVLVAIGILLVAACVAVTGGIPFGTRSAVASITTGCGLSDAVCLAENALQVSHTEGLVAMQRAMQDLYMSQPEFRPFCYLTMGRIGERLAEMGVRPHLGAQTAVCNYGLLHEYVRVQMVRGANVPEMAALCNGLRRQVPDIPNLPAECFRALGKGIANSSEDLQGSPAKGPIEAAAATCKDITADIREYRICVSGLFNGIGWGVIGRGSSRTANAHGPLHACTLLQDELRGRCYSNMKWIVIESLTRRDIVGGTEELLDTFDDTAAYAPQVVFTLGYEAGRFATVDPGQMYDGILAACAQIPAEFARYCVSGAAVGLVKNGTPWQQHEMAIDFCVAASRAVPAVGQAECVRELMAYIRGFYPQRHFTNVCRELWDRLGVSCEAVATDQL